MSRMVFILFCFVFIKKGVYSYYWFFIFYFLFIQFFFLRKIAICKLVLWWCFNKYMDMILTCQNYLISVDKRTPSLYLPVSTCAYVIWPQYPWANWTVHGCLEGNEIFNWAKLIIKSKLIKLVNNCNRFGVTS